MLLSFETEPAELVNLANLFVELEDLVVLLGKLGSLGLHLGLKLRTLEAKLIIAADIRPSGR